MKKSLLAALFVGASILTTSQAWADEKGDIILRLRAVILDPEESGEFTVIGGEPKLDNPYGFELDASYFFTDHLAAELIFVGGARVSPRAVNTVLGDVDLGTVIASPAAITGQYHFLESGSAVRPYVGAGVNYIIFSFTEVGSALESISYDNSFGVHVQAGANIRVNERWSVNLDVKRLWNDTSAAANSGAITANVDLDPWIYGIGLSYRF